MSATSYLDFQPSSFSATSVAAHTATESPARRSTTLCATLAPVAASKVLIISSTDVPLPVPWFCFFVVVVVWLFLVVWFVFSFVFVWTRAHTNKHKQTTKQRLGTEVDRAAAKLGVAEHLDDGAHVALGEVHDVDVVAHGRAVGRRVVAAKDAQKVALPERDLLHVRHQVVGDADGVLAQVAARVRADRVEVAQQQDAPALVRRRDVAFFWFCVFGCCCCFVCRVWGRECCGGMHAQQKHPTTTTATTTTSTKTLYRNMSSWKSLVRPYGLIAASGAASVIGVSSGRP